MKRIIIIITSIFVFVNGSLAQQSAVDKLFEKYAFKDGFSTVFISKAMFELFINQNETKQDPKELEEAITGLESIKILTIEDSTLNKKIDFFAEVGNQIPFEEYTTLMMVKEKDSQLRMVIKKHNNKISEFLMLSGGNDNVLISIKGNVNLNSISKISDAIEIQKLKKMEKEQKEGQ